MATGKHFANKGDRGRAAHVRASHGEAAEGRSGYGENYADYEGGFAKAGQTASSPAKAASSAYNAAPNTTDPFSPDYVDPALSKRERKRARRRAQPGEPESSGSRGWTFLYVVAALVITVLVWVLFGGGV